MRPPAHADALQVRSPCKGELSLLRRVSSSRLPRVDACVFLALVQPVAVCNDLLHAPPRARALRRAANEKIAQLTDERVEAAEQISKLRGELRQGKVCHWAI